MATSTPCEDHCRRWLAAHGLSYCATSREAFARAHPALCGHAYDVTLRGYERWLLRQSIPDQIESFAIYLSSRFNRLLIAGPQ